MYANKTEKFCCIKCGYFTNSKSNLNKHFNSKKHKLDDNLKILDSSCKNQCNFCLKKYQSQPGLWKHKKVCKNIEYVKKVSVDQTNSELSNEIKELKTIIVDMVKNHQPIINNTNNNNTNNITNNINVFLNDKCGNAINLVEFMEKIKFEDMNFEKFLLSYVGENM